jgi:hypothetical protein
MLQRYGKMGLMRHYGLWPLNMPLISIILPNSVGICPHHIFLGSTIPRYCLLSIHVWGCPVFALDPKLQAGEKIPRLQPRSRQGVFMGFRPLNSSDVPLVLNLQAGGITPQFHVVFDNHFSTAPSVKRETDPPDHWADVCLDNARNVTTDDTTNLTLHDDWLTEDEGLL